jgi:PilZ domain-containing protein
VRSNGRIPKEVPILLIGSDLAGKVFSEPTKTVVLSRHGAGLLSRHKLYPEQELVLRCPGRNLETEIRIVGQVGEQSGLYTYGVAFLDPRINFWAIEFPPLSPAEIAAGLLSLVCCSCSTLEKIDDTGIESDVCATNEGVIRFCKRCGCSTLWKQSARATDDKSPVPPALPSSAPVTSTPAQASAQTGPLSQAAVSRAGPAPAGAYLGESPAAVLTVPPPEKSAPRGAERRKHPRVRVNYSACVRHPGFLDDDIVVCEDLSRGGLRFKSRRRYYEQSFIEVAVPYSAGQSAIFVPARIVFVQELPEQNRFRCGASFLNSTKPRSSF